MKTKAFAVSDSLMGEDIKSIRKIYGNKMNFGQFLIIDF